MAHTPHLFGASYVVLRQSNQVLLQRRYQTGFMDGHYSLPAGHIEKKEAFSQALVREIKEEIGVILESVGVRVAHIMHRFGNDEYEAVDFFYVAEQWQGEPKILEPDKADELSWHDIHNLPTNTVPYVRQALQHIVNGIPHSEYFYAHND